MMVKVPLQRCAWAGDDPLYVTYHDREWGVPLHDERRLFEMLILEGAHAAVRCHQQGLEAVRLQVRGFYYLLCLHAGRGHGQ